MVILVKIVLMLTLVSIAYQDLKDRMIYLFLFPLCGLCFGFLSYKAMGWLFLTEHLFFNVLFIGITLTVIGVYYRLKYGFTFAKAIVGKGDYWMFFATCFAMSSSAFILFSLASTIAALIVVITLRRIRDRNEDASQIPLAGYMAIFYILLFSVQWSIGITSFYN